MMGGRRQIVLVLSVLAMAAASARAAEAPRVSVVVPAGHGDQPIDGRLLLLLSTDPAAEPRMQIGESVATQMVFGMDVDGVRAGQPIVVRHRLTGLSDLEAERRSGRRLLRAGRAASLRDVPPRRRPHGEAADGSRRRPALESRAGKPLPTPQKVTIGGGSYGDGRRSTRRFRRSPRPKDTKYIRHLKIQSELLTKFWGRPMFLGANVLVPEGFDEHPNARYPADDLRGPLQPRLRRLPDRAARSRT